MPNKEECEHLGYFEREWYCKIIDDELDCENCQLYNPYNDRCKSCSKRYICFETNKLACEEYEKEIEVK